MQKILLYKEKYLIGYDISRMFKWEIDQTTT